MTPDSGSRGCVLLADDDRFMLQLTDLMLRRLGFRVVCAADGAEAVRLFTETAPDLIFLDVNMPVMDGHQASTRIRQLAGTRWVPIVFLTGASEEEALGACVEAGGDEFLSKPISTELLNAKLIALDRIRALHEKVQEQNQLLDRQRQELVREQEEARELFERLAPSGSGPADNIKQYRSVATVFSGDILLSAWTPGGVQCVLLGDFTGHGLPAALCAIPLTDVFHGQVARNATAEELIQHIDARMRSVLPDHMFLALGLVTFDARSRRLTVWNGGLPAPLVWRRGKGVVRQFTSRNLPLGLAGTEPPRGQVEEMHCEPGDRVYLYSDGLVEARSASGEMFGADRVINTVLACEGRGEVPGSLASAMNAFRGAEPLEDDVTMVELSCEAVVQPINHPAGHGDGLTLGSAIELGPQALRSFDPVGWVQGVLGGIEGAGPPLELVRVVIAELYANALDHGVLVKSSSQKHSPEGFAEYYRERESALAGLREGRITIGLDCRREDDGWFIGLRMADSGPGFDHVQVLARAPAGSTAYSGRGIAMVRGMCDRLSYLGCGNTVVAECSWHPASSDSPEREPAHQAELEVVR